MWHLQYYQLHQSHCYRIVEIRNREKFQKLKYNLITYNLHILIEMKIHYKQMHVDHVEPANLKMTRKIHFHYSQKSRASHSNHGASWNMELHEKALIWIVGKVGNSKHKYYWISTTKYYIAFLKHNCTNHHFISLAMSINFAKHFISFEIKLQPVICIVMRHIFLRAERRSTY